MLCAVHRRVQRLSQDDRFISQAALPASTTHQFGDGRTPPTFIAGKKNRQKPSLLMVVVSVALKLPRPVLAGRGGLICLDLYTGRWATSCEERKTVDKHESLSRNCVCSPAVQTTETINGSVAQTLCSALSPAEGIPRSLQGSFIDVPASLRLLPKPWLSGFLQPVKCGIRAPRQAGTLHGTGTM